MSTEHWILAAIVVAGFGLNAWIAWQVQRTQAIIHQAQVVEVLQGRSIKDVVDELHRILLNRGGAR
jgi:Flp pilus assembly protein CpaB